VIVLAFTVIGFDAGTKDLIHKIQNSARRASRSIRPARRGAFTHSPG